MVHSPSAAPPGEAESPRPGRSGLLLEVVTVGAWVGVVIGLFEVAVIFGRPGASVAGGLVGGVILALAGVSILAVCGVPLAVLLHAPTGALLKAVSRRAHPGIGGREGLRRALTLGLLLAAGVAGVVDGTAYRNLYPTPHLLLGLAELCAIYVVAASAARGAARRWGRPVRRALVAGALVWVVLGIVSLVVVQSWQGLRATMVREGSWISRVATALPSAPLTGDAAASFDDAGVPEDCAWPSPAVVRSDNDPLRPDVLLITVDAVRGDLGGSKIDETFPETMRRLSRAVVFDRAYAPAPRTVYSSYAMLTGLYPTHLDFVAATTDVEDRIHVLADDHPIMVDPNQWRLRHRYPVHDQHPTLAGLLSAVGYESTAIIPDVGLVPASGITREFSTVDPSPYLRNGRRDAVGITSGYSTDAGIEVFQRWAGGTDESGQAPSPQLAWIHYLDPHHPYEAAAPATAQSPAPVRYLSEIQRVDREIARLLDVIETARGLDHTLVILTGDHGEEFRDHGGLQHGTTLYEELMHVPLVISVPTERGPPASRRRVSTPVTLVDLVPTILDLLGVSSAAAFDGRSLMPALGEAPSALTSRPLFLYNTSYTESFDRTVAVVDGDLKFIVREKERTAELYDLRRDPGERTNLVDASAQVTDGMRCLLRAALAGG